MEDKRSVKRVASRPTKQIPQNAMVTKGKKLQANAETGVGKGKKRKNSDKKGAVPREGKKKKISNRGAKKEM